MRNRNRTPRALSLLLAVLMTGQLSLTTLHAAEAAPLLSEAADAPVPEASRPLTGSGSGYVDLCDGFVYHPVGDAVRLMSPAQQEELDRTGRYRSILSPEEQVFYDNLEKKLNEAVGLARYNDLTSDLLEYPYPISGYTVENGHAVLSPEDSSALYQFISNITNVFLRDHPQVFWISTYPGYSYQINSNTDISCSISLIAALPEKTITIFDKGAKKEVPIFSNPAYQYTLEKFQADEAAIETKAAAVLADAEGLADWEKVHVFSKYLTSHNKYSSDVANNVPESVSPSTSRYGGWVWSIQSAFLSETNKLPDEESRHGPVCEGYSKAMKLLCDRSGIPCVLASGQGHMWNYVRLSDQWYGVDVTFNDPVVGDGWKVDHLAMDFRLGPGADAEVVSEPPEPAVPGDVTENSDSCGVTNWLLLGRPKFESYNRDVPQHQRSADDVSRSIVLAGADYDPAAISLDASWDGSAVQYTAVGEGAKLILAHYRNGRMTGLELVPCTGSARGSYTPEAPDGTVSLFLLDSASAAPLCSPGTVSLTAPPAA